VRFDFDEIKDSGYDPVTPVVVTNAEDHPVSNLRTGEVSAGEPLFDVGV
jgi:sugar PTS system EIIA component